MKHEPSAVCAIPLAMRLSALRKLAEKGLGRIAAIAGFAGFLTLGAIGQLALQPLMLSSMNSSMGSTSSAYPAFDDMWAIFLIPIITVVLGVVGAFLGYNITLAAIRRSFTRLTMEARQELVFTNLITMVVEEPYIQAFQERIDQQAGLRWLSPPPPRKLEHQLEYAACYQLALRRMLAGVGRVDNGPLWQGAIAYTASQSSGGTCGCLSLYLFNIFGLGLVVVGCAYYLQRCAALAAICDHLLADWEAPPTGDRWNAPIPGLRGPF